MNVLIPTLPNEKKNMIKHRDYLKLAVPLIIAGISTPILGAIDTAVVGRMSEPAAIGGVAIGAVIFNTMYWLLGFLRVSTSGFTAQAEGSNNDKEMLLSLIRPTLLSFLFGILFILFQRPILSIFLALMGGSDAVLESGASYFVVRIWGAPFILMSYTIIGWLIGLGKVRLSLATQVMMNVINIILDFVFVFGFGMGVVGVAYATVIAEISVILIAIILVLKNQLPNLKKLDSATIFEPDALWSMLKVNRDLFLRTVCLITMTFTFTSKGANMDVTVLAANAILLQMQYIMAYFFGGFANASSILVGRAVGRKQMGLYRQAYRFSAQWGLLSAVMMASIIVLFGDQLILLFTTIPDVQVLVSHMLFWMIMFPLVGFWGLQLEGIFSGATEAKSIRNAIFFALIIFLIAINILVPYFSYHGMWLAFILFSLSRSIFLSLYVPKLNSRFRGR